MYLFNNKHILFLLIGLASLSLVLLFKSLDLKAKKEGPEKVQAYATLDTILSETTYDTHVEYKVDYFYEVDGIDYKGTAIVNDLEKLHESREIPIVYQRENPSQSIAFPTPQHLKEPPSSYLKLMYVFGFFATLYFWTAFSEFRRRKKAK